MGRSRGGVQCLRGLWSLRDLRGLWAVNEPQVAAVDEEARGLPHDEYRVALVDGVDQQHAAAGQAQVPEGSRDDALFAPLGGDPLHEEAAEEEGLAEETDGDPEIAGVEWQGSISSGARRSIQRFCIQRTAKRSASDRQMRLRMLYLDSPYRRGRWWTGASVIRAPSSLSSVGRKRCMPVNRGMRRRNSAR